MVPDALCLDVSSPSPAVEEEAALFERQVVTVGGIERSAKGYCCYAIVVGSSCHGDVLLGVHRGWGTGSDVPVRVEG